MAGIGSPIIVPSAAGNASAFPTLADFYVPLAKQLGAYVLAGVSATVPSGEPGRWVILDELKDDEDERAAFMAGWISVKNGSQAGTQRRIRAQGYEGPSGAFALTRVLPSNLQAGTAVEVTNPLPVRSRGMTPGLVDFVNQGLERAWTEVRVPLTGNGTRSIGLSAYPWITSDLQADGVYDWPGYDQATAPSQRSPYAASIAMDGATLSLVTTRRYASGTPIQLKAYVPSNRLTFDGSAWGYSGDGLVNDTDQAAISVASALPLAMAKALQHLLTETLSDETLPDARRQRLATLYQTRLTYWTRAANLVIREMLLARGPSQRPAIYGFSPYPDPWFQGGL